MESSFFENRLLLTCADGSRSFCASEQRPGLRRNPRASCFVRCRFRSKPGRLRRHCSYGRRLRRPRSRRPFFRLRRDCSYGRTFGFVSERRSRRKRGRQWTFGSGKVRGRSFGFGYNGRAPCTSKQHTLTLSPPIPLRLYTLPYWSNPPCLTFWHSGTLALRTKRQSARMSKIKNGGLDRCGAGPFEQQQFGPAGVEEVNVSV